MTRVCNQCLSKSDVRSLLLVVVESHHVQNISTFVTKALFCDFGRSYMANKREVNQRTTMMTYHKYLLSVFFFFFFFALSSFLPYYSRDVFIQQETESSEIKISLFACFVSIGSMYYVRVRREARRRPVSCLRYLSAFFLSQFFTQDAMYSYLASCGTQK